MAQSYLDSLYATIMELIKRHWNNSVMHLIDPITLEEKILFSNMIPSNKWFESITKPTINIYLYKVAENLALRSNEWRLEYDLHNKIIHKKSRPRVNCSYVVTAWAKNDDNSQPDMTTILVMLSEVMTILLSYPDIPRYVLQDTLVDQDPDMPVAALLTDDVRSQGEFWTAIENKLVPFLHYVVTLSVEPRDPYPEQIISSIVTSIGTHTGLKDNWETTRDEGSYAIGGSVYEGSPLAAKKDYTVRIIELYKETKTNETGHYTFDKIEPGTYTFKVFDPTDLINARAERIFNVPPDPDRSPIDDIGAYSFEL